MNEEYLQALNIIQVNNDFDRISRSNNQTP